jgi:hypothetical protein
MLGFIILRRGVWAGHLEVHTMSKEELPQGRFVELTSIVAFNSLNLTTKLSAEKRKELGDSQKCIRL